MGTGRDGHIWGDALRELPIPRRLGKSVSAPVRDFATATLGPSGPKGIPTKPSSWPAWLALMFKGEKDLLNVKDNSMAEGWGWVGTDGGGMSDFLELPINPTLAPLFKCPQGEYRDAANGT